MGKLVIDGDSIYEVDEECLKNHQMPKNCILPKKIWEEIGKKGEKDIKKDKI